jgi:hypothetical protein
MIVLVDPNDSRAVRNKENVLALYEMMINQKKSEEATAKFVSPEYIQHNPLIPDGSEALGQFFGKVTRERKRAKRCYPPHHRSRRLRVGPREFSESVQRRPAGYRNRRCRYLQNGLRRKSRRALGHLATGR